jgi:hypothetical protein
MISQPYLGVLKQMLVLSDPPEGALSSYAIKIGGLEFLLARYNTD